MHSFSHFRPADIHTPKNTLRSLEAVEFQQHASEVADSPGAARSRGAQPSSRLARSNRASRGQRDGAAHTPRVPEKLGQLHTANSVREEESKQPALSTVQHAFAAISNTDKDHNDAGRSSH